MGPRPRPAPPSPPTGASPRPSRGLGKDAKRGAGKPGQAWPSLAGALASWVRPGQK